jgi:mevalonate kinase
MKKRLIKKNKPKIKKVVVSAPGKLLLFGEHAVVHGQPCIVTAVDRRIKLVACFNGLNSLVVNAPQLGVKNYQCQFNQLCSLAMPKQVSFIESAVARFIEQYQLKKGLVITTSSQFSHTHGFGSSSAVTVATIKALSLLYNKNLADKQVFDLSYQAVLDIQKVGSGFDLAAALWGRTLYFKKGAVVVKKLLLDSLPFIVCYSGVKADTPTLVKGVGQLKKNQPDKTNKIFDQIGNLVLKAEKYLLAKNWPKLGKVMNNNQALLKELGVSTPLLEKLIKTSLQAGALGAKLSGAGGGDNIIVLCLRDKKKTVQQALTKAGGQIMKVKLNAKGVDYES